MRSQFQRVTQGITVGRQAMKQQKRVTASPGDRQDTDMLSMYDQPPPPSTHTCSDLQATHHIGSVIFQTVPQGKTTLWDMF